VDGQDQKAEAADYRLQASAPETPRQAAGAKRSESAFDTSAIRHPTSYIPTIAHVLHRLYLAGAEVLAADLARRMSDRYRFVFLCLDEIGPLGQKLAGEGFPVIDLQRHPGIDWSVARRIRGIVREQRIDLLHAHQYTPFFYAALSRRLATRPPILFTEHGRHYPDVRKRRRIWANKLLLRKGDRVTAVGQFVKQALVRNEGIAAGRIAVIHNGIDAAEYRPEDKARHRAEVRRELGLAPEQLIVLQVARFHPVKDHATGLKAFAATVKQPAGPLGEGSGLAASPLSIRHPPSAIRLHIPSPVLLLVGDGEKRPACEQLARELNLAPAVQFLGVRTDVPRLVAAADVFLLSSLSEGISVTLLEAMAAGVPIAATQVGGNPEVVLHGQTGLLSPRADAPALGANLATLLADAALRQSMGDAGRGRFLELFTQDRMHREYAAIYAQMLG
jgi:L-malate glycosyltransferase